MRRMLKRILKNNIARNATWIIGCKIAQCVIGLILSMLTARYFGPANFGLINYAASIAAFVTPIALLGFNATLVRELVCDPENEDEILGTAIAASLVSDILCIIGIVCFVLVLLPNEKNTLIVCTLYSSMLLFQSMELIQYWFQAKLMSKYTAVCTLIAYMAVSVYQILLMAKGMSVEYFAVFKALEYAVISVGLIFIYLRKFKGRLRFSLERLKQLFRSSRLYMVSMMLVMLYVQTDRIMIKMMLNDEQLGHYSAAVNAAMIAEFVYLAIIDSFRPSILRSRMEDRAEYENGMTRMYACVISLSIGQGIVFTVLAGWIIPLLYGKQYLPGVSALRILTWYSMFANIGSARMVWMQAENRQNVLWRVNLCGAVLNIVLNAVLIPVWGINGAAAASFFTQVFTNYLVCYIIKSLEGCICLMHRAIRPRFILDELKKLFRG